MDKMCKWCIKSLNFIYTSRKVKEGPSSVTFQRIQIRLALPKEYVRESNVESKSSSKMYNFSFGYIIFILKNVVGDENYLF